MRRAAALLFALAALLAAAPAVLAAPRGCFTDAEETAELDVRQGIRLREGANGCAEHPFDLPTAALWAQIDKTYGPLFANQTRIRHNAFQREFATNADNRESEWNARIVTYFRNYPLTDEYCGRVRGDLEDVVRGGWAAFTKQAAKGGEVVRMTYNTCPGQG